MYGGVSLCIYINGVAQELLRLVRATAQSDKDDDEVAAIYRELATQAPSVFDAKKKAQTRFVVDILSGTSAGGINAVFLAKALASRSKNLNDLRDVWLNKADMKSLLNTRGFLQPKRSLLKGPWMYQQLLAAFVGMNSLSKQDPEEGYSRVEQLDLFVTTTDLNGVQLPMMLADRDVSEKAYKGSFHFRLDQRRVDGTQTSNDFLKDSAAATSASAPILGISITRQRLAR